MHLSVSFRLEYLLRVSGTVGQTIMKYETELRFYKAVIFTGVIHIHDTICSVNFITVVG